MKSECEDRCGRSKGARCRGVGSRKRSISWEFYYYCTVALKL